MSLREQIYEATLFAICVFIGHTKGNGVQNLPIWRVWGLAKPPHQLLDVNPTNERPLTPKAHLRANGLLDNHACLTCQIYLLYFRHRTTWLHIPI